MSVSYFVQQERAGVASQLEAFQSGQGFEVGEDHNSMQGLREARHLREAAHRKRVQRHDKKWGSLTVQMPLLWTMVHVHAFGNPNRGGVAGHTRTQRSPDPNC